MELRNGIDLVEVERIARSMEAGPFLERFFSPEERALLLERKNAPQSVAANFAAKEAFAKAMGTGVRGFRLDEVSVLRDRLDFMRKLVEDMFLMAKLEEKQVIFDEDRVPLAPLAERVTDGLREAAVR